MLVLRLPGRIRVVIQANDVIAAVIVFGTIVAGIVFL
jgi:hypothetical protein